MSALFQPGKGAVVTHHAGSPPIFSNRLLNAFTPDDLEALRPHLKRIDLPRGKMLESPLQAIGAVCFVEDGIVSIVQSGQKRSVVEVGVIGFEGATGIPIFLGNDRWPYSTYPQVAGWGYSISASAMRRCMSSSPTMVATLQKYVQSYLAQVTSTATSRADAGVDRKLARWLLMAHHRHRAAADP